MDCEELDIGLNGGPVAEAPLTVFIVVRGLKVTVRGGLGACRDVVLREVKDWCRGSRGALSLLVDVMMEDKRPEKAGGG